MPDLPTDEWRVEVELDDERHGFPLSERLRAHDLDDEARERLGGRVIVTRDGSRLYLYTTSAGSAREAERVVRELIAADNLTAATSVTRWDEERDAWVAADTGEVVEDNRDPDEADYFVRIEPQEAKDVGPLEERLQGEGLPVERRGRYLLIGSHDDEEVEALAQRVRAIAGPDVDVQVRADVADLPDPRFILFESYTPGIARDLGL
jgi:hypothetical protein